jgi:NAD(P)-dependent dehydrogenase (short-subunit alcohol dehydrogenase family)
VAKAIRAKGGKALGAQSRCVESKTTPPAWPPKRESASAASIFLFNNAAIFINIQRHPFYEISGEEWDKVSAVNIKGPVSLRQGGLPADERTEERQDLSTSLLQPLTGARPTFSTTLRQSSADRHDALAGARSGEFGICVNAIAPGLVEHEGQNAPRR